MAIGGQSTEEDPATGLDGMGERTAVRTAQNCPYFFICAGQNIPVIGGIFSKKY